MKILFIAPLPPPVTGQSLASKTVLNELEKYHSVEIVNFNKGTFQQGFNSFTRIIQILKIFKEHKVLIKIGWVYLHPTT